MILDARGLVTMVVAACVGEYGLHTYPMSTENPFLGLISLEARAAFQVLSHGYATLWFTTPFFAGSLVLSMLAISTYHLLPAFGRRPFPRYPAPDTRPSSSLVLGEAHFVNTLGRAPHPTWLMIPQRASTRV